VSFFVPTTIEFDAATRDRTSVRWLKVFVDTDGDGDLEDITSYLDLSKGGVSGGGTTDEDRGIATKSYQVQLRNIDETLVAGAWANRKCAIEAKVGLTEYIRFFTGYIDESGLSRDKRNLSSDFFSFRAYDPSKRLGMRTQTKSAIYLNFKICDTVSPSASLFHALALGLGLSGSVDIETVSVNHTKDYLPVNRGVNLWKELQELNSQYIGHLGFRYDGKLRFVSRHQTGWTPPTSEWTFQGYGSDSEYNIHSYSEARESLICNRCKTEFDLYQAVTVSGVIYKNTDNWDSVNQRCQITLAAGAYWPGPNAGDVARLRFKDPTSGEGFPVGASIITPTIGADGASTDIESSGGLATLISFNGSPTDATRQNADSAEIILKNNNGGSITLHKLTIRGTAYRVQKKLTIEDVDATVTNEWDYVDKELPGKYAVSDTQAHMSTLRWIEFGKIARERFSIITDWIPQIQEGAVVTLKPDVSTTLSCIVSNYSHMCSGQYTRWRTTITLRELESFTVTGSPNVIVDTSGNAAPESLSQLPTFTDLIEGFDAGGGTTTPTAPTIAVCKGAYRAISLKWDKQLNLTNFDHYEIQVSADQASWYSLKFDGTDWKDTLGAVTAWTAEILIHTMIPNGGTVDVPTAVTLYYRVRRAIKVGSPGSWSANASATTVVIGTGDLGAAAVNFPKMAGGYGLNMLPNGDFSVMNDAGTWPKDWSRYYSNAGFAADSFGVNLSADWSLMGNVDAFNRLYANTLWLSQGAPLGLPNDFDEYYFLMMPVIPGHRYCLSVYTGAHRCKVGVAIEWFNAAFGGLGASSLGDPFNDEAAAGGKVLSGYKRIYTYGDAPTGAAFGQIAIKKFDTKPGQTSSYMFLCRAAFEEIGSNATVPGLWMPPPTNIVTAGMILAGAVIAGKIGALAVDTAQLAALAVTAAKIAANTITANEIVAAFLSGAFAKFTGELAVGQDYTGSPPAGAQRIVIDGNELRLDEWDGSAWQVIFRIGGDDALKWYLQARGLIKTGTDISGLEIGDGAPSGSQVFDFENDYQDKTGADPWDTKLDLAFSVLEKFGSYALSASAATGRLTDNVALGISAVDFGLSFWHYKPARTEDRILFQAVKTSKQIGSGLPIAGIGMAALARLNATDVAFIDSTIEELRTYHWNGSAWSLLGTGLSIAGIYRPALTALNATDVAYIDNTLDELRTYRWNESTWSMLGSGLSIPTAGYHALTKLNATDIALFDSGADELRTYRWSGSSWSLIGSGFSIVGAATPALTALNATDVAFIDEALDELRTYRWNGSTWSLEGTGLSISATGTPCLAGLNATDVAYIDSSIEQLRTYRWSGSSWSLLGTGLSIAGIGVPALAALNTTTVAFIDDILDELRTYSLVGMVLYETATGYKLIVDGTVEQTRNAAEAQWHHVGLTSRDVAGQKKWGLAVDAWSVETNIAAYPVVTGSWLDILLDANTRIDDLAVLTSSALLSLAEMLSHYAIGQPWVDASTGIDMLLDLILMAKSGGKIKLLSPTDASGGLAWPLLYIEDQKASGTSGGDSVAGAWTQRVLNTVLLNSISGASLASNRITLPAGTYFVEASAPVHRGDNHKLKLYNYTDSTDIPNLMGSSEQAAAADNSTTRSFVKGVFTLATQKTVELRHRVATAVATYGFGVASSMSVIEVYAQIEIRKIA